MKILNLGCGRNTYGTHRVDVVETLATTHVFDVEDGIKFEDDFFDVIYERNLLEHLRNVGFHLQECHRVLKKDGKLVIITDNAGYFRFYVKNGYHMGGYVNPLTTKDEYDRHYSLFTTHHLENHLKRSHFKIDSIEYASSKLTKFTLLIKMFFWLTSLVYRKAKDYNALFYSNIKVIAIAS